MKRREAIKAYKKSYCKLEALVDLAHEKGLHSLFHADILLRRCQQAKSLLKNKYFPTSEILRRSENLKSMTDRLNKEFEELQVYPHQKDPDFSTTIQSEMNLLDERIPYQGVALPEGHRSRAAKAMGTELEGEK